MLSFLEFIETNGPTGRIKFQKGSCVRQRFKHSSCNRCTEVCTSGALSWRNGNLHWDPDKCQQCLLCCAFCPTGSLSSEDVSFITLLQKLNKADHPVLVCHKQVKSQGHARVPCLGIFANKELLLALSLSLNKTLTLNMINCRKCINYQVITPLEKTINQLPPENLIELVYKQGDLKYKERQCSRREFFSLMRPESTHANSGIVNTLQFSKPPSDYVSKHLPVTREFLIEALKYRAEVKDKIALWPHLQINNKCQHCNMCIAICPTGALSDCEHTQGPPTLKNDRCVACGLCEEFCTQSAIKIINDNNVKTIQYGHD